MAKLSFVMPTRNRIEWLPLAIQSLLGQTEKDIEVVIVNDASDDGTKEFLDDWASKDPRVTIIHNEKPIGAGASRNKGAHVATSPIIAVCDDDDVYVDTRAEETIRWFENHPESELVNFPYVAINYFEDVTEAYPGMPFDHDAFKRDGSVNYFSNPTAAYRREVVEKIGGYPSEKEKITDDYQFLEKWVSLGKKVDFSNADKSGRISYMTMHRILPDSMMSKIRGFDPKWLASK